VARLSWQAIRRSLLGLILGKTFAIGGALIVAALTGIFSGLEPPWSYTLALGLGFLTLWVLDRAGRTFGPGLPLPWGQQGDVAGVTESTALSITAVQGPQAKGYTTIDWEMSNAHEHAVRVPAPIRAVRLIRPVDVTVRKADLPKAVRWRLRKILLVKSFAGDSVLVDEYARGCRVRAEVYHDDA